MLARLVLAVLAIWCAVSCTAEPPRGLVLWHSYRGVEKNALDASVQLFEQQSGTRVTLLALPAEAFYGKLEAAIPHGNGPDLFVGPHNRIGESLAHRLIAPVADAFPDADVDRYDAIAVQAVSPRGVRYAVPLATKCVVLYYDRRLFPRPPGTLEELLLTARAEGDGRWPLVYEAQSVYYHAALLHAFGGRLFDETPPAGQSRFAMTGDAAERSLAKARELVSSHAVPDETSGDLVKQLFASGRAVAAFSGPWLAADLDHAAIAYDVAPLPAVTGAGKMRPLLTVDGVFLTPEGAKLPEARALARSLGSIDAAWERAEHGDQIVATKAYWDAPARTGSKRSSLEPFRTASADAIPMPVEIAFNPIWEPAKEALRKAIRGDASPRDALDEARARYEDVMRPPATISSGVPFVAVVGLILLAAAAAIVRRVRAPGFGRELRASRRAYGYVAHAVLTVLVLVVLPLVAGALLSFTSAGAGADLGEARFVGLSNYFEILTARGKPLLSHGSFYLTLLVTIVWTVVNVALHVGIGLVLGVALANPLRRLRAVYRVLLILPWAVPSYVTALAWKGMFHRQFGAMNALLEAVGAKPISWFGKFSTAFAANVATNVWLGFPFMMVVVMGALTSISKDVLEAAEVDGATRWQTFRLVTLPLLRPTLLPAVVLGSVWTFNMFNVVFLVSGGEPDGTTDILVSEAYRWAFARNAQLGYAAAYAVVIFGLLAITSSFTSRLTRTRDGAT